MIAECNSSKYPQARFIESSFGGASRLITEVQVHYSKYSRSFVPVSRDGELLPEVKDVLEVIARHSLIVETGHSTSDEVLMLIREAQRQGVREIVVTHAIIARKRNR